KWQNKSELPPMEFLFRLRPLNLKEYKKCFVIVDKYGILQAFLSCSPIYAKNGWYLEDLIRDHTAPNGCTELLVTETLKALAADNYEMASFALAPLAGLPDKDESHPLLNKILRLFYKHMTFIYHFQTLEHFKSKFQPSHWEKNYFCYDPDESLIHVVGNMLRAFIPYSLPTILKHKIERWLK
ncbi:MAG: DUF2156 domain-containing protein, partial [Candidatus Obscuribacterales bacterium]|nr:DUF2156 domain-containing protein [Candidatus Obscuribacterales bacterium]